MEREKTGKGNSGGRFYLNAFLIDFSNMHCNRSQRKEIINDKAMTQVNL